MTAIIEALERRSDSAGAEVQKFAKWLEDMAQQVQASFLAQNFEHYGNTDTPTVDVLHEALRELYCDVRVCLEEQASEAEEKSEYENEKYYVGSQNNG